MAYKYLGPRIDIHGGGADLIFPHHTCEIAQSENATGEHPFVQVWMHCAMVYMDGEKMSKSLGNLVRVGDLLKTYSPDAIRVLLLRHHYRAQWEWAPEEMEASAALAARLRAVAAGGAGAASAAEMEADAVAGAACEDFVAALEDDLDTPQALEVLERLAGAAESGAGAQAAMLRELGGVLGLRLGA